MHRVIEFIQEHNASNIAIFSHVRGDGDCLGAQTGLAEILCSAGLTVVLYNQEELSPNFSFLPRFGEIHSATTISEIPDVCIAVDCATLERIGDLPEQFLSRPWINIDHHISNDNFGKLNIVDGSSSSTCEIIGQMAFESGIHVSKAAATALFSGISTDTGSFLYPSAKSSTFYIAAKLLEFGADKSLVQSHVFENTSKQKVKVLQYLYDNIKYVAEEKVAYCIFSQNIMKQLQISVLDLEGIVSLIKEIQGVEVAVLFTELDNGCCKISLRSREWFDCNRCCNVFGGGGHVRASGATICKQLDNAVVTVLNEIAVEWEDHQYAE